VILELECGVVGRAEDDVEGDDAARLYTDTTEFLRVAEVLGTGERGRYLLAPAFGNAHGLNETPAQLRPEILSAGQEALSAAHAGARFDYVFHGSSGTAPDDLRGAIANGVVKVNLDTDAQYAFTRAVAGHVFANYDSVLRIDGRLGSKAAYDPRSWGRKAEAALAARVAEAAHLLGSAAKSVLR